MIWPGVGVALGMVGLEDTVGVTVGRMAVAVAAGLGETVGVTVGRAAVPVGAGLGETVSVTVGRMAVAVAAGLGETVGVTVGRVAVPVAAGFALRALSASAMLAHPPEVIEAKSVATIPGAPSALSAAATPKYEPLAYWVSSRVLRSAGKTRLTFSVAKNPTNKSPPFPVEKEQRVGLLLCP